MTSNRQQEIIRNMSFEQKLKVLERLYWSTRDLKKAAIRSLHPNWPLEKVEEQVRKIFLHGE